MTYSPGAQAVVIEVDLETGRITLLKQVVAYDVGRAINPLIVRGQIEGGAAQGIGGALLEEFVYSEERAATGHELHGLPPADGLAEIPPTEVLLFEDATNPLNQLGVKGAARSGQRPAGAAIAAALTDADRRLASTVSR